MKLVVVDIFQSKNLVRFGPTFISVAETFGNTNKSQIKQKQGKLLSQYFAISLASAGRAGEL